MSHGALPDPDRTREAFEFTWQDAMGQTWEVRQTQQPSGPLLQRFLGEILRHANQVGVTRRLVRNDRQIGLVVEHVAMNLDQAVRGCGFATEYWLASLSKYQELGVKRVTIQANDDGTTFWARPGVHFDRPDRPRDMLAGWTVAGEGTGPAGFAQAAAHLGIASELVDAFVSLASGRPNLLTPEGLYRTDLGKLLLKGASWSGFVDIRHA